MRIKTESARLVLRTKEKNFVACFIMIYKPMIGTLNNPLKIPERFESIDRRW
jgi:hypothetical protein